VNKISSGKVNVTISSEPINFEISVGESKKFDVNSDGSYDLLVFLKELKGTRAVFVLTTIDEKIIVESDGSIEGIVNEPVVGKNESDNATVDDESSSAWVWIILIIVLIVLVVGAVIVLRPQRIEKWIVVKWKGE